jgi:hypothetical protein
LQERILTHGRVPAAIAGKEQTLSCQVGAMKVPSCASVLSRNTGAVSRMKSFQNCPGSSGSAGGGARRIVRSSKPLASRVPAKDSSTTNTTR